VRIVVSIGGHVTVQLYELLWLVCGFGSNDALVMWDSMTVLRLMVLSCVEGYCIFDSVAYRV